MNKNLAARQPMRHRWSFSAFAAIWVVGSLLLVSRATYPSGVPPQQGDLLFFSKVDCEAFLSARIAVWWAESLSTIDLARTAIAACLTLPLFGLALSSEYLVEWLWRGHTLGSAMDGVELVFMLSLAVTFGGSLFCVTGLVVFLGLLWIASRARRFIELRLRRS